MTDFDLNFPRAHGVPPATAKLKIAPEDFYVEEQLGFPLSGAGEHLYLYIEKRNQNTQSVAEHIARIAGLSPGDVGYSGMKDNRAVTRQWFSVYLRQRDDFTWQPFSGDEVLLLDSGRHHRKLRRGEHQCNFFRICLRDVQGNSDALATRLSLITEQGVPNYYGEQRFGRESSNLRQADALVARAKGKQQRHHDRLLVSAMRSWLFNQVLALRVQQGCWHCTIEGDPEVFPSASLWGRGRLSSRGTVCEMEERIAKQYPVWCEFLEHCGLQQARRSCILKPGQFSYRMQENTLVLEFVLPPGAYATSLIREIVRLSGEQSDGHGV